jgi:hypothetical protein
MKYIKYFETRDEKIDSLFKSLKEGDYVIVNAPIINVHNELMKLKTDPEKSGSYYFTISALSLKDGSYQSFYEYEIVKKITPEEAEIMIDTAKYNL